MIKKVLLFGLLISTIQFSYAQNLTFNIFDKEGNAATFEQMVTSVKTQDVILFGELHNSAIAHWLQLQLLKELHKTERNIALSGEFFERDDQLNIDEWFAGKISEKNFEAEAKLWNNYQTDYKPLMRFAKEKGIGFIASNVPRKYASLVSREGLLALENLSDLAKTYIAPLPIDVDMSLPGYVGMKQMMHGSGMNTDYMIQAQAIKDATMAFSLEESIDNNVQVYHINGSYHSNNYEGIVWYLMQRNPSIALATISTVEQDNMGELQKESVGIADFIIVLPLDSPKSY
ncbi:ChaN family lipoprotein [Belliella kenyensis]|uniref:ChaN family lipoprotein n=1 Tax=Belliella kenyensis TaxID=1472724 RepID=A0ABV8EH41_9BACT|nr:ChaN family lipoprotein [Belliella kenyensis]MCH7401089.1 ChaN family lipoprotein [Belliella kenyensis]MDN3604086.1 ChaN family lipoprotein [Belliella kenyensis]